MPDDILRSEDAGSTETKGGSILQNQEGGGEPSLYPAKGGEGGNEEKGASTPEGPAPVPSVLNNNKEDPEGSPWFDKYTSEVQSRVNKFKTVDDLVKSYLSLEENMSKSRKAMDLPSKDAPQHEWDRFYDSLGRPKSMTEYNLDTDDGKPMLDFDARTVERFRKQAYDAGLNQTQAVKMAEFLRDEQKHRSVANEQKALQTKEMVEDNLKKSWGEKYEANLNLAQTVFNQFLNKDQRSEFISKGFDKNTEFLLLLKNIGQALTNDESIRDLRGSNQAFKRGKSPEDLSKRRYEILQQLMTGFAGGETGRALNKELTEIEEQLNLDQ